MFLSQIQQARIGRLTVRVFVLTPTVGMPWIRQIPDVIELHDFRFVPSERVVELGVQFTQTTFDVPLQPFAVAPLGKTVHERLQTAQRQLLLPELGYRVTRRILAAQCGFKLLGFAARIQQVERVGYFPSASLTLMSGRSRSWTSCTSMSTAVS